MTTGHGQPIGPTGDAWAISWATMSLLLLTQGPVISVWSRNAPVWDEFAVPAAITSTYSAVYAVTLFQLGRGNDPWRRLDPVRAGLLVALAGLVALSTVWSTSPSVTGTSAVNFAGVIVCGAWFGLRLTPRQQAVAILAAMQIGLISSSIALARDWSFARDINGDWTGIYYNRNSLAPVAALAVLAAAYLALDLLPRLHRPSTRDLVMAGALVVGTAHAGLHLLGSHSLTSLAGLLAAAATVAVVATARRNPARIRPQAVAATFLGVGAIGITIMIVLARRISQRADRGDGYSSRTQIWRFVTDAIRERPFTGWGFNAAWWDPTFRAPLEVNGWFSKVTTAHNGYLEIVLGVGAFGGLLILAVVATAVLAMVTHAFTRGRYTSWPLALGTFCLVANLQESLIIGNHFVWLLLVTAILVPVNALRASGAQQVAPDHTVGAGSISSS